MRFLKGVVLHGLGPKIFDAMDAIDGVYWSILGFDLTVTSGREGRHSLDSKHYFRPHDPDRWPSTRTGSQGAFDCRTWPNPWTPGQWFPAKRKMIADAIRHALDDLHPKEFWVLEEKTHIHVQHDPILRAALEV